MQSGDFSSGMIMLWVFSCKAHLTAIVMALVILITWYSEVYDVE